MAPPHVFLRTTQPAAPPALTEKRGRFIHYYNRHFSWKLFFFPHRGLADCVNIFFPQLTTSGQKTMRILRVKIVHYYIQQCTLYSGKTMSIDWQVSPVDCHTATQTMCTINAIRAAFRWKRNIPASDNKTMHILKITARSISTWWPHQQKKGTHRWCASCSSWDMRIVRITCGGVVA